MRVAGIDVARRRRDAERRALDERDDAVVAAERRARARRPRLRHRASTLAGLPVRATGSSRMLAADEDRRDRAAVVRRSADRLRRDRARRRRCSPTASSTPATTSRCSRAAGRDQGDARLAAGRAARPGAARQPVVRRVPRARRRTSQVDDFDVVHDHSRIIGPVLRRAAARATRRWCTRCTGRGPSQPRRSTRCSPSTCISSRSATRSAPTTPTSAYAGIVHNGIDLDDYPYRDDKDDFLVYIGRANPDKGPTKRSRSPGAPGFPLHMILKTQRAVRARVLEHEIVAPLLDDDVEVFENVTHEEKVDLLGRARAMVFPIRWPEPFGLVMVEAMACGTPVVDRPTGRGARAGRRRRHRLPPRRDRRPGRGGRPRSATARPPPAGAGSRTASRADGHGRGATRRSSSRSRPLSLRTDSTGISTTAVVLLQWRGRWPAPTPWPPAARDRRPPRRRRRPRDPARRDPRGRPTASSTPSWARTARASRRSPTRCSATPPTRSPRGRIRLRAARTSPPSPTDERAARGLFLGFQHPEEIPGVSASSTSCARRWPPARASTTSRCSRCACSSWSGRSASAWTTASRSATSTRASPAARRSATRSCRWRCWSPTSPCSTRPTPASTSTRCATSPPASTRCAATAPSSASC